MTVFLDTNVLLDALIASRPGHRPALQLFQVIKDRKIMGMMTSQSIIDAAYVQTQRLKVSVGDFKSAIRFICSFVSVIAIDEEDIERVNLSSLEDYEDAAQVSCALNHGCDLIVSSDKGLKKITDLDIFSAQELIDRCLSSSPL